MPLIDFLLRPDMARIITEKIGDASPNAEATKRLKAQLRDDPTVYPGEGVLSKGEYQTDIGPAITIYSKY